MNLSMTLLVKPHAGCMLFRHTARWLRLVNRVDCYVWTVTI